MNIYSGYVLTRPSGAKYLVAHTNVDKFQLISLEDGNRWSNDGIKTSKEGRYAVNYVTKEQISSAGAGFFGEFTVETKEERKAYEDRQNAVCEAPEPALEPVPCCGDSSCLDSTCDFYEDEEEFEITEKDINYVVSHTSIHMPTNLSAGQIVDRISRDIFKYLKGDNR